MPDVRVLAPVELHERVRQRMLQGLTFSDKRASCRARVHESERFG
jgi:hypothetical protein